MAVVAGAVVMMMMVALAVVGIFPLMILCFQKERFTRYLTGSIADNSAVLIFFMATKLAIILRALKSPQPIIVASFSMPQNNDRASHKDRLKAANMSLDRVH